MQQNNNNHSKKLNKIQASKIIENKQKQQKSKQRVT